MQGGAAREGMRKAARMIRAKRIYDAPEKAGLHAKTGAVAAHARASWGQLDAAV